MSFDILPAIDLRAGRVVRLVEGDFDRETAYGRDPGAVAVAFAEAGARLIHLVDLDGARAGSPIQLGAVAGVVTVLGGRASCEVAGGLRRPEDVDAALAAGPRRVVLGTAALSDPAFAADLVARHGPDRVAVALDVRNGQAVGEGWRSGAQGTPAQVALEALAAVGVETFEVTAIERDGRLEGPDLALLGRLVALGKGQVIASGGIRSVADLEAVRDLGCSGAIVGRALYEGGLDLGEAIASLA